MVLRVVVPCVVCQNAPTQRYSFVVAGQPECPAGFTLDYNGYFMSHAHTQSISEHVCVDSVAQSIGTSTSGMNVGDVLLCVLFASLLSILFWGLPTSGLTQY